MKIDNNILAISKVMFQEREKWKFVSDEQKESFFFIFNRYFSKKYPQLSQLLNQKDINKSDGMDMWFNFMKDKSYPKWFWSKSEKEKEKSDFSEKDLELLCMRHNLRKEELDLLIKYNSEEVKEELKYILNSEKQKSK